MKERILLGDGVYLDLNSNIEIHKLQFKAIVRRKTKW